MVPMGHLHGNSSDRTPFRSHELAILSCMSCAKYRGNRGVRGVSLAVFPCGGYSLLSRQPGPMGGGRGSRRAVFAATCRLGGSLALQITAPRTVGECRTG